MIKGLVALAVTFGWMAEKSQVHVILTAVGDGAFYFLPLLLAMSAAKIRKQSVRSGCHCGGDPASGFDSPARCGETDFLYRASCNRCHLFVNGHPDFAVDLDCFIRGKMD